VLSPAFIPRDATGSSANDELLQGVSPRPVQPKGTQPNNTVPLPNTQPAPPPVTPQN